MILKTSKAKIYFKYQLSGTDIPYFFIHGFTGSSESWNNVISMLDSPYIAIDVVGHGKSSFLDFRDQYSVEDWCYEIYLLLQKINIKKINLCGYSLGGRLSIAFAKKYPDLINSLVLESCSLGIETIDEKEKKYSDDLLDIEKIKNNYKNFIKEWEEKSLFKTQKINNKKEWNSQKEIRKNHNNAQLAKSLEVFSQGNMRYYKNEYIDFNFPISIINGSHDNKYVKIGKKIAYLNRNAKQYIVNNSGHNTHLEQPELFLDILNESIYK